tara:strand:+ start:3063 stop:3923 length:861 start_codon:yes stop_codon:yes gene_type:complete
MTIVSSGQITMNDIVAEFGGSGQHGLTEYYRGGSFVSNNSLNTSIPTSGQISLTDFYGAQAYTLLSVLGHETWKTNSTSSTTSTKTGISVPSGTKSVVIMGGIGTNNGRRTVHTGATFGGSSLTEVASTNNTPAEYTFDSAIYAGNTNLTGSQTATMTYSNSQQVYGSGHIIIFLNKPFNSFAPSVQSGIATTSSSANRVLLRYGEGLQLATGTVRSFTNLTNFTAATSITLSSGSDSRRSVYGFNVSPGTYNVAGSLNTTLSTLQNDFGETFQVATFAPTKFNEP